MANLSSDADLGLKEPRSSSFTILEDTSASSRTQTPESRSSSGKSVGAVPLVSSRLLNVQTRIPESTTYRKNKLQSSTAFDTNVDKTSMDALLRKLSFKQDSGNRKRAENQPPGYDSTVASTKKTFPAPIAPPDNKSKAIKGSSSSGQEMPELSRLKQELDAAKNQIARQDEELSRTRAMKDIPVSHAVNSMQDAYNAQRSPWLLQEDAMSDVSDALSAASLQNRRPQFISTTAVSGLQNQSMPGPSFWNAGPQRPFANRSVHPSLQPLTIPQTLHPFSTQISPVSSEGFTTAPGLPYRPTEGRVGVRSPREPMNFTSTSPYSTVGGGMWSPGTTQGLFNSDGTATPLHSPAGVYSGAVPYPQRSMDPYLSATADEFSASGAPPFSWTRSASPNQHTYINPTEPLNYRRLLDKGVSCDWGYIVDKIVHNNDQQASIFLQQKLKVATVEQKRDMVQAIIAQAFPLMVNRFGNFLVQRCFEHGTPEQVIKIAEAIRGKTVQLSMDPFGCHVIQKAFDAVPEDFKAIMVHELLRHIPETVVHRYACHVWQKLFELRWSDSPPQIMKYVNEALKGMWHEVALGETGSLVVQNIFENCLEEDKRPCIEEVLNSIDIVAHGQFGNWCIQHICEHGTPADRNRAVDHVLKYATEYSMDQFASKVVEKCLKISGADFLDRFLSRVCEGRPDRPRIPLIDIASDQYGNYLIQYILTHASAQHREVVASHIRKHMVSLRGSKFGSRVGMLCSNPAYATRPATRIGSTSQSQRYTGSSLAFNTVVPMGASNTDTMSYGNVANSTPSRYGATFR